MPVEQLCFFKFQRPLLERFGAAFFKEVPRAPGVYLFTGERGRVLYVGQSKDLRTRLAYYKNAQPEREPRRIIRLVHQTTGIQIECCNTIESARLREIALIGQHRPRFNVAHTLRPSYSFFALRECQAGFSFRLSVSQAAQPCETIIGAFRNRGLCGRAFCSLARTLVAQRRPIHSIYDFPAWLHPRAQVSETFPSIWQPAVEEFLRGEKAHLLECNAHLAETERDIFLRQLYEVDLVTLSEFFDLARQMRTARAFHELPVLSQEALHVTAQKMRDARFTEGERPREPFFS